MSYPHRQIAYDASILREGIEMDQKTVETILKFYMAKLGEAELRELDDLLAEQGTSLDTPRDLDKPGTPAMDAALGDQDRQRFLKLGPSARNAMRKARTRSFQQRHGLAQDAAPKKDGISVFDEKHFPNANRMRGY